MAGMEESLVGHSIENEDYDALQLILTPEDSTESFIVLLIEKGGPWSFNSHLLILHGLQEADDPMTVPLVNVDYWVLLLIHDIPLGFMSKRVARLDWAMVKAFVQFGYIAKIKKSPWNGMHRYVLHKGDQHLRTADGYVKRKEVNMVEEDNPIEQTVDLKRPRIYNQPPEVSVTEDLTGANNVLSASLAQPAGRNKNFKLEHPGAEVIPECSPSAIFTERHRPCDSFPHRNKVAQIEDGKIKHIDVMITNDYYGNSWRFTGFYGAPDVRDQLESWQLLQKKQGGLPRNEWQMNNFRNALADCNLEDMGFKEIGSSNLRQYGYSNPLVKIKSVNCGTMQKEQYPKNFRVSA
ncbi:hypothetical protein F3Y22_tig00002840pilonHSYRG01413 [Hibiscus syriacus]|uniref:Uncharacterized protein n=1 Tax=Hibiscus syriacus TaxID=106335 RepID=A0A6A3CVU2_HIBSY|nr:hypothetical protein F3Y22_tig00002840pilonHSYRG01413 [Hibiscus syriacus]